MRRREFIAGLGCATAWPIAALAQQPERIRRIGVLTPFAASDEEGRTRVSVFRGRMRELGWIEGRNVRFDTRWGAGNAARVDVDAAELTALEPDVLLANSSPSVAALRRITRAIPIVFVSVADPVGSGFVESLARPGGNATGFMAFEYAMSTKWLELLKQIAPGVTGVVVLRDPSTPGVRAELDAMQSAAPSLQAALIPVDVRDNGEVERALSAMAGGAGGLIVLPGGGAILEQRHAIIALAARHQLPAIYPYRYYVVDGGLISYGADPRDPYRRAAGYVDRILKGEKAAGLPVQAPTKFELVINLKTAKVLGLDVPPTLLARADEVIE